MVEEPSGSLKERTALMFAPAEIWSDTVWLKGVSDGLGAPKSMGTNWSLGEEAYWDVGVGL